jgi:NAD(P)-dependent dehydrogenase (short-subunit alcohol dehydrogenase family)
MGALDEIVALNVRSMFVTAQAVAPTYIETPMTAAYFANEAFRQKVLASIPLSRTGRIEEVVAAVLFSPRPTPV